ncbi:MAG: ribonuclease III [Bacteroidales bacterium]|nr:ribonuclease III [Bacteroidales bacterium]
MNLYYHLLSIFRKNNSKKYLYLSIKNIFGFYPKNIFLYQLALRHKSVSKENIAGKKINNERLEYLGDAILGAVVADFLFKKFPYNDEGFLTEMRSKIVSRASLNKLSQKIGLDQLINLDHNSHSIYRSINGDAFEAFVGALYIDRGYNFTKKIIVNRIIKNNFNIDELINSGINYKSRLIEWSQKEKKTVDFNVVKETGNGYKKQYFVEVVIDNKTFAIGCDFCIKGAEKLASEKAFKILFPED